MSAIAEARKVIGDRLSELDTEKRKLERALDALSLNGSKPRRGRPPVKRGRRRSGGGRREDALSLIVANPGITASEIAGKLKMKPNYLYRVLADLGKDGKVKKKGRAYTAA
jgi:hypothetical protein